jgi:ribosomal protein S27E
MKYSERWRCPECGNTVTVYVRVSEPPTCNNQASHSGRVVEMATKNRGGSRPG